MVRTTILSALFLSPTLLLASSAALPEERNLEKRAVCNAEVDLDWFSTENCDGDPLTTIRWKNTWDTFNYQDSRAKSFRMAWSDWVNAECVLRSDINNRGNTLAGLYRVGSKQYNCVTLPDGSLVKSVECKGNFCTHS